MSIRDDLNPDSTKPYHDLHDEGYTRREIAEEFEGSDDPKLQEFLADTDSTLSADEEGEDA